MRCSASSMFVNAVVDNCSTGIRKSIFSLLSRLNTSSTNEIVQSRGDRGWLSHGLVVTLPISYSLGGGTLWGFTRDMRIAD